MRHRVLPLLALVAFLGGGCSSLPTSGPNALVVDPRPDASREPPEQISAFTTASTGQASAAGAVTGPIAGYELVDLDSRVAEMMMSYSGPSLVGNFGNKLPAPRQQIGIGDTLSLTIFEAAPGGLFSPPANAVLTGSRFVVIPNQTVDRDGTIEVPYAGRIRAAGLTPAQISRDAENRLKDRAIEPKVIVSMIRNAANQVSVLGDVVSGARVELNIRGERILSVIAAAGGTKAPEHETLVKLQRGGKTETVPLRTIMARPQENIFVQPDDTIFLLRSPVTFTALGAVARQGQHPINAVDMSVSDGLGAAGGLLDARADLGGVFLVRYETPALARSILGRAPRVVASTRGVPMVYRIRLSDPRSFHWLSSIVIRDRDVVYVANAPAVEFEKIIGIFRDAVGGVSLPLGVARSAGSL